MKFLPYKKWVDDPNIDSVVFFDSEEEALNARFSKDKSPFGALVSDENLKAEMQNEYWWVDFQIGEEASLLEPDDFEASTFENDVALVVNKRNAEDMYRIASKATQIKCEIWCEDEELFGLYKRYPGARIGTPERINSKVILAFPEHDRIVPKYVGAALCQNVSLLAVSSHSFSGYRTCSYWDNMLDFSVGYLRDYYMVIDDLVGWIAPNAQRVFSPRKYYLNHLGPKNIMKRFGHG
jgi:hypothetical protein